jgi:tetratricopeptide (TPR) repeat protein
MSPARRPSVEPLDDAERLQLEAQTRRNLDGMEHEGAGRLDLAIELYEQNVAEGFPGDWPYSRLVSAYERQGAYDQAERVLRRAIEVTRADRRKPAADRRTLLQGLQGRLRLLKKTAQAARARSKGGATPGHAFIPLPMLDNPR